MLLALLSSQHFLFPLLLAISVVGLVNGLYKLLNNGPLVPNPTRDMVYLFQFPRTSTCPSQAALNLKVETWLMWHKISFHRVSNHFFLGSLSTGTAPFIELNGGHIDGSNEIINKIAEINKIDINEDGEDEVQAGLRTLIDDQLFKILMFDRAYNTGQGRGLDFMLTDEGIIQQMVPLLIPNEVKSNGRYQITLNSDTWKAYFDVSSEIQKEGKKVDEQTKSMAVEFLIRHWKKIDENKQNCISKLEICRNKELDWKTWKSFNRWLRKKVIKKALASVFKASSKVPGNSEDKLQELLAQNTIEDRQYSSFSEAEMLKVLQVKVTEVLNDLKIEHFDPKSSLFTPAHASLFGFAVQFFETPLNYPQFRKYSKNMKNTNVKMLREYVDKVKVHLGLDKVWETLKSRPWPLNWEPQHYGDKHDGQFYTPDEKKVGQNVLAAIGKAKAIVVGGMAKDATAEQKAAAKNAVSDAKVGNEY